VFFVDGFCEFWQAGCDADWYCDAWQGTEGPSEDMMKQECTCWSGYERVPGTKPCASDSCRKKSLSKHLDGQHDQRQHGAWSDGKGDGGASAPDGSAEAYKPAALRGDTPRELAMDYGRRWKDIRDDRVSDVYELLDHDVSTSAAAKQQADLFGRTKALERRLDTAFQSFRGTTKLETPEQVKRADQEISQFFSEVNALENDVKSWRKSS
jgi:hypothetical protein